jgi:hypothetical protein
LARLRLGHISRILRQPSPPTSENPTMEWTTPTFVEIKMDAEIGSYQQDDEPTSPIADIANDAEDDRSA